MYNNLKLICTSLLALMLLCAPTLVAAQESIEVRGKVISYDTDEPLIGATVMVKGTANGAVTDIDGEYKIKAKKGDTLVFSYFSMKKRSELVSKPVIDVALKEQVSEIDEVVVIGYGSVRKKEVTGASSHVTGDVLDEFVTNDLAESMQGLVAGVSITSSNEGPGEDAIVQIRGVTSLVDGDNPLYVVDGIPQEGVPMLNNSEIKSIDILKDAASASIYGTRGAAGVILVTTKEGEVGKMKVAIDASFALSSVNFDNLPHLMNSNEQTYYQYLYFKSNADADEDTIDDFKYPQINNVLLLKNNFDHTRNVLGTSNALEQKYSVMLSGGTKQFTYNTTFGFSDTEGVIYGSGYSRYSMRTNLAYKGERTKITQGISFNYDDKEAALGGAISTAMKLKPYNLPVKRGSTSYVIPTYDTTSQLYSTVNSLLKQYTTENVTNKSVFSYNVGFDYTLLDGLTLNTKGSFSIADDRNFTKAPQTTIYNLDGYQFGSTTAANSSYIRNTAGRRMAYTFQGGLSYVKKINKKHSINAIAMATYEEYDYEGFWAKKTGIDGDLDVLNSAVLTATVGSNNYYNNRLFGGIGRAVYSYDNRYVVSASMRADASSKFPKQNRWGYFPSASFAWNVTEEDFFKKYKKTINNMKVRLSYGTTGNQNVASYTYQETANTGYDYVFGEKTDYGLTSTSYPNYDIKWETSKQYNFGVDVGFLKNKFTLTADYYNTTKEDMLSVVKLPVSSGVGAGKSMVQNIGDMINRGYEVTLNYNAKLAKDLSMQVGLNYFSNYNEIISLGSSDIIYNYSATVNGDPITVFVPGREAGAFYLYKHVGVIKTSDQLLAYRKLYPLAQMGDMMYANTNGDEVIDEDDKTYCGGGTPDFEMGLNLKLKWKRFDFATQWFASVGNDVMNGLEAMSFDCARNYQLTQMWTPENPTSNIPTTRGAYDMTYAGCSDVWLEDGSFIKMKLISLGYTVPIEKMNISSFRIFISAQNLLTLTKYSGLDPEVGGNGLTTRGIDKANYPKAQKILMGVKVNF